jgi:Ca-activated chloride channel family protein
MARDDGFAPSAGGYAPPSADELMRDALIGTHAGAETELSSRMQVRTLKYPRPPRGATARFNLDDGKRGWVTSMLHEEVLNTPAFVKGRIVLGGGFASHEMYALKAYSGELDWSAAAPDGGPSSPIAEDGKILFNTESCELFAVDAETGKQVWHKWLGDPLMSQPAAAGGLVFSAYPQAPGHRFGAFRIKDGETVWSVPIDADVVQAPQVRGDSVYFATMAGTTMRIARADGRVLWSKSVGAASAPAIDDGRILVSRRVSDKEQPIVLSAADGKILSEGETFEAPWFAGKSRDRVLAKSQAGAWGSVPHGDHLGLENVAAGWAFQGSTASVADGRAYYAVGGEIRAREVKTGREVWRRTYANAKGAQAVTPPAIVGGQIVFGTVDGRLYAVDVDTGMTVWAYDVGEPIVFQPIVAQGWVYTTTAKGHVLGLELGDPSFDGWHMWGGNAEHAGLVETAGALDPRLVDSLARPGEGTMKKGEEEMPLAGTEVRAKISGTVARVRVVQHFQNPYREEIEALYLFPLPEDAAVDAMEMKVGDHVVRAEIKRREDAKKTYEEAKAGGKKAALLEQQRPNLFAQRVANIAPGDKVDVTLTYVENVKLEDGRYELVYPMVAPKRHDSAPVEANAKTIAAAGTKVGDARKIDLEIDLDAGMPIATLESPTHAVDATRPAPERALVRLAEAANRDFVLRWGTGGEIPRATVIPHRAADAGYFSLIVQPPAPGKAAPIAPRDLTLLVDTSSSMRGRPLEYARAASKKVLEGLRAEDTLRVIAFADDVRTFDAAPATRENVTRASAFLDAQRACGATTMAPAVRAALAGTDDPARVRLAVLVSDGFIGNEADVLGEIARGLGGARFYALGIGSVTNRFLLERAAEIGRGRAIVVTPSEDSAAAAARFASHIDRPVLTDVAIDWGGLDVSDVYPRRVPDLFAGRPLVVTGRYAGGGKATVVVRGTYGGKRYERAVVVDLPQATGDANEAQRSLWARVAVHDRMMAMTLRDEPRLVDEVTHLGLAFNIVTPWTSFVAVDGPAVPQATQAMISPARALPGDPEIRIAAPADARAVTVDLPFGESIAAQWDEAAGVWVARFLIPKDDAEGMHAVRITVTRADGSRDARTIGYVVDSAAPHLRVEVLGAARPGAEVTIRATQLTGDSQRLALSAAVDTRRVEARLPGGAILQFTQRARGVWEARWRLPEDARGTLTLHAFAVDVAANVADQPFTIEVGP